MMIQSDSNIFQGGGSTTIEIMKSHYWLVVWNMDFQEEKASSQLTNIFQRGWNHQLVMKSHEIHISLDWFKVKSTGNHGFYMFLPSNIGFSCKISHHPILWKVNQPFNMVFYGDNQGGYGSKLVNSSWVPRGVSPFFVGDLRRVALQLSAAALQWHGVARQRVAESRPQFSFLRFITTMKCT